MYSSQRTASYHDYNNPSVALVHGSSITDKPAIEVLGGETQATAKIYVVELRIELRTFSEHCTQQL